MLNIPDLYVLGDDKNPIETPIGECRFVKVHEWSKLLIYGQWLSRSKYDLLNEIEGLDEDKKKQMTILLSKIPMFDFIMEFKQWGFYNIYNEIFEFFFNKYEEDKKNNINMFDKIINQDEFEKYIQLIKNINCIRENEKPNPNPEIEKFNRYKREKDEKSSCKITFESMYTSVWTELGTNPSEMTIYQFNKVFDRIKIFKTYDATTLFSTVSNDVKIIQWCSEEENEKDTRKRMSMEEIRKLGGENLDSIDTNYKSISKDI
jgi:succinate dehydrogenase flavin-adding protein (antitoxin of CptAB toxin-antitoxin module)